MGFVTLPSDSTAMKSFHLCRVMLAALGPLGFGGDATPGRYVYLGEPQADLNVRGEMH